MSNYFTEVKTVEELRKRYRVFIVKQNYPKLQNKNGQSCMSKLDKVATLCIGSKERCSACVVATKCEPIKRSIADITKNH